MQWVACAERTLWCKSSERLWFSFSKRGYTECSSLTHCILTLYEWQKDTNMRVGYRTGVNGNWKKPSSLTKRSASEDEETAVLEKTSVIRFPSIPRAHTHTLTCMRSGQDSRKSVWDIALSATHTHAHKSSFQLSVLWVGAAGKTQSDAKKESIAFYRFSIEIVNVL